MTVRLRFAKFVFVGLLAVSLDFLVYFLFLRIFVDLSPAKTAGYLAGTTMSFFGNRTFTFSDKEFSLFKFIVVYALGLGLNIMVNQQFLYFLDELDFGAKATAWFFSTLSSMLLNFVLISQWVTKPLSHRRLVRFRK